MLIQLKYLYKKMNPMINSQNLPVLTHSSKPFKKSFKTIKDLSSLSTQQAELRCFQNTDTYKAFVL